MYVLSGLYGPDFLQYVRDVAGIAVNLWVVIKTKQPYHMQQDIKNKEPQERQAYVPASVKVINVTAQRVVCTSPGRQDTETEPEETVF